MPNRDATPNSRPGAPDPPASSCRYDRECGHPHFLILFGGPGPNADATHTDPVYKNRQPTAKTRHLSFGGSSDERTDGFGDPAVPEAPREQEPAEQRDFAVEAKGDANTNADTDTDTDTDAEPGDPRIVRQIFGTWILIYGVVGAQMGWILRPFIGTPGQPFEMFRERESNFFAAFLDVLRSFF